LPRKQQKLIETKLDVKAFPTYILFDKSGDVANSKAPRPSQLEELTKEIYTLLK
jgi:hypothetical protein